MEVDRLMGVGMRVVEGMEGGGRKRGLVGGGMDLEWMMSLVVVGIEGEIAELMEYLIVRMRKE